MLLNEDAGKISLNALIGTYLVFGEYAFDPQAKTVVELSRIVLICKSKGMASHL